MAKCVLKRIIEKGAIVDCYVQVLKSIFSNYANVLPVTISSRLKVFWPARLVAIHVQMPASLAVTGSMIKECIPFSRTSILWELSERITLPLSCQLMSGVGKPLTLNKIHHSPQESKNIQRLQKSCDNLFQCTVFCYPRRPMDKNSSTLSA